MSGLLPAEARPIKNELLTASRSRSRRYREVHGVAVTTAAAVAADIPRWDLLDLRKAGLEVIPNFRFGPYTWDAGFPTVSTLTDLGSFRFHGPDTFIVDRWKTNQAEMAGWGHLRFTDFCLSDTQSRSTAVNEIGRMVEHRGSVRDTRRHPRPVPGRVITDGVWKFHG